MNGPIEIPTTCRRFLQINDLHARAPGVPDRSEGYKGANERARWLLDAIAVQDPLPSVDWILGLGDLVHGESLAGIRADLAWFKEAVRNIATPLYPIMGNHEVRQNQGIAEWEAPFFETFGSEFNNYTLSYGDWLIVLFNNSGTGHITPAYAAQQTDWLRQTLAANPSRPTLLVCHVPLIPLRDQPVLAESFGFRSYLTLEPEILELVETHRDTIRAVLSGHLHLTGMVERHGIRHISISGTASPPGDYALYPLRDDNCLAVSVRQVPASLQNPWETDIHGERRHGKTFTDATHPTAEAYLMGNPAERDFVIPL